MWGGRGWVTIGKVNSGENGCGKMHNFALSLTVMGSVKIFPPSLPFPLRAPLPPRDPRQLFPLLLLLSASDRPRGDSRALGSSYILHHSQPRAERRVRGPGGLGAEFSRDPGPGERERVRGGGPEWGDPLCVSPERLVSALRVWSEDASWGPFWAFTPCACPLTVLV